MIVPENLMIQHERDFSDECLTDYMDEPYFRLFHNLKELPIVGLQDGFVQCNAAPDAYAEHINTCYSGVKISVAEIKDYIKHKVYAPNLWIAVQDRKNGEIVATGISELDMELGEGIIEWIQVSPAYRGIGLGTYLVAEMLQRMAKKAKFATVSGRVNDPSNPEMLYRKCGFTGDDVWHILKKRHA